MYIFNPRQTVLVSCRGLTKDMFSGKEEHKDNIIVLDWHMPLSFEPFLYGIAIGKTRFSLELIRESKVFAVNFMPLHLKDDVIFCGRNSGQHIDKFKETNLLKEECEKIDCPKIKQALAHLECEIINEIETGDHILFIGKVVHEDEKETGKRIFHTEDDDFTTTQD